MEKEQRNREAWMILETLKYNPMCYNCGKLHNGCKGEKSKIFSGCVFRSITELNIYALAAHVPALIKNGDFKNFDNFLECLENNRAAVIEYLKACIRVDRLKTEYIEDCKKILQILNVEH